MADEKVSQTQQNQEAVMKFNDELFMAVSSLKTISGQFKYINQEQYGFPIFRWRNQWMATYNNLLAQYISQVTENSAESEQNLLEETVTRLVEAQEIIKKLFLLEELHKGEIDRHLAVKQDKFEQKVVKNTEEDLFADFDDLEAVDDIGSKGKQKQESNAIQTVNQYQTNQQSLTSTLGEIRNSQAERRATARIMRGSAAKDLFEGETALPIETTTGFGFQNDRKAAELEEELQRSLTKKERAKLDNEIRKGHNGGELGWNERDILDGITDRGDGFKGSKRGRSRSGQPKKKDRL